MPEGVLELWASLPRRERQRSRRRYFRNHGACCSRPVFSSILPTIDICIQNIEHELAEFLHATAASILVPSARSGMKRTREDAGSPSSPAPANTSNEIISDIYRAGKLCSDALSPSPALNISTLTALCAADELMAELTAEPTPTTATPQLEPKAATSTEKPGAAAPRAAATSSTAAVPPQPNSDSHLSQPHSHPTLVPSRPTASNRSCPPPQSTLLTCYQPLRPSPAWPPPPRTRPGELTTAHPTSRLHPTGLASDFLPDSEAKHRHYCPVL